MDLPLPETPVTANQLAQRELHIHILQIITLGATQPQTVSIASRRLAGTSMARSPFKYWEVSVCVRSISRGVPGKNNIPSQPTSFRPHINDIIGGEHHILVMLHHNDGVANVTQFLQRVYQALVVALVQADTRLVQNISHSHQTRTDLSRQANPLASPPESVTVSQQGNVKTEIQTPHTQT